MPALRTGRPKEWAGLWREVDNLFLVYCFRNWETHSNRTTQQMLGIPESGTQGRELAGLGHVFINSRWWEVTAEEWGWFLEVGCVDTEERRYEWRFSDKHESREREWVSLEVKERNGADWELAGLWVPDCNQSSPHKALMRHRRSPSRRLPWEPKDKRWHGMNVWSIIDGYRAKESLIRADLLCRRGTELDWGLFLLQQRTKNFLILVRTVLIKERRVKPWLKVILQVT